MNMNLINILEKGKYTKYYKYFTIDKDGEMSLWQHKPRPSHRNAYWECREEYRHSMVERVVFGDMNSVQENWKEYIWKIQ